MNLNDAEEEINNMIEYKRLIYKLEDEIKKKNSENEIMSKLNNDLKNLCNNLKNECEEQNKKLLLQYEEIKNINKKYKEEIKNININFDKQKIIYEDKIKQLSAYNPINQKLKIEKEIEMRYEEKIKLKENQIEILNNKIKLLQNENNDLKKEKDDLKQNLHKMKILEDISKDRYILNNEINNNINNDKDNNYKIIKELQEIINNKENKITMLYNELNKNDSIIKKYKYKF